VTPVDPSKLPVTVVIPVLNEEKNLPDCIRSVAWADEVFVVDSGSTDRTGPIAQQMGATLVQFQYKPGGPRKKNWSLDNLPARHQWILLLDADERITPELEAEIRAVFASGAPCDGYYLNRKHIFLGQWLKHGGNFPSWNMRLLKRHAGRYERLGTEALESAGDVEVHEHILMNGPTGYLQEPMLHLDYKGLHQFIDRHNRYSTWDAKMRQVLLDGGGASAAIPARFFGSPVERKRFLKKLWVRLPLKPLARFIYMYFIRLGFLDGRAGFIYCVYKMIQEFHISTKMYEMSMRRPATPAPRTPTVESRPAS
jgi:glycosyltransferase involved in cell wall biosynthesis